MSEEPDAKRPRISLGEEQDVPEQNHINNTLTTPKWYDDIERAQTMAGLASDVYSDPEDRRTNDSSAWDTQDYESNMNIAGVSLDFARVSVSLNKNTGELFITFRGTDKLAELMADVQFTKDGPENDPRYGGHQVTKGASIAFESLWPQLEEALKDYMGNDAVTHINVSGHSLGGAMTQVLLERVDENGDNFLQNMGVDPSDISANTYGAPTAFIEDGSDAEWHVPDDYQSYENMGDPVPTVTGLLQGDPDHYVEYGDEDHGGNADNETTFGSGEAISMVEAAVKGVEGGASHTHSMDVYLLRVHDAVIEENMGIIKDHSGPNSEIREYLDNLADIGALKGMLKAEPYLQKLQKKAMDAVIYTMEDLEADANRVAGNFMDEVQEVMEKTAGSFDAASMQRMARLVRKSAQVVKFVGKIIQRATRLGAILSKPMRAGIANATKLMKGVKEMRFGALSKILRDASQVAKRVFSVLKTKVTQMAKEYAMGGEESEGLLKLFNDEFGEEITSLLDRGSEIARGYIKDAGEAMGEVTEMIEMTGEEFAALFGMGAEEIQAFSNFIKDMGGSIEGPIDTVLNKIETVSEALKSGNKEVLIEENVDPSMWDDDDLGIGDESQVQGPNEDPVLQGPDEDPPLTGPEEDPPLTDPDPVDDGYIDGEDLDVSPAVEDEPTTTTGTGEAGEGAGVDVADAVDIAQTAETEVVEPELGPSILEGFDGVADYINVKFANVPWADKLEAIRDVWRSCGVPEEFVMGLSEEALIDTLKFSSGMVTRAGFMLAKAGAVGGSIITISLSIAAISAAVTDGDRLAAAEHVLIIAKELGVEFGESFIKGFTAKGDDPYQAANNALLAYGTVGFVAGSMAAGGAALAGAATTAASIEAAMGPIGWAIMAATATIMMFESEYNRNKYEDDVLEHIEDYGVQQESYGNEINEYPMGLQMVAYQMYGTVPTGNYSNANMHNWIFDIGGKMYEQLDGISKMMDFAAENPDLDGIPYWLAQSQDITTVYYDDEGKPQPITDFSPENASQWCTYEPSGGVTLQEYAYMKLTMQKSISADENAYQGMLQYGPGQPDWEDDTMRSWWQQITGYDEGAPDATLISEWGVPSIPTGTPLDPQPLVDSMYTFDPEVASDNPGIQLLDADNPDDMKLWNDAQYLQDNLLDGLMTDANGSPTPSSAQYVRYAMLPGNPSQRLTNASINWMASEYKEDEDFQYTGEWNDDPQVRMSNKVSAWLSEETEPGRPRWMTYKIKYSSRISGGADFISNISDENPEGESANNKYMTILFSNAAVYGFQNDEANAAISNWLDTQMFEGEFGELSDIAQVPDEFRTFVDHVKTLNDSFQGGTMWDGEVIDFQFILEKASALSGEGLDQDFFFNLFINGRQALEDQLEKIRYYLELTSDQMSQYSWYVSQTDAEMAAYESLLEAVEISDEAPDEFGYEMGVGYAAYDTVLSMQHTLDTLGYGVNPDELRTLMLGYYEAYHAWDGEGEFNAPAWFGEYMWNHSEAWANEDDWQAWKASFDTESSGNNGTEAGDGDEDNGTETGTGTSTADQNDDVTGDDDYSHIEDKEEEEEDEDEDEEEDEDEDEEDEEEEEEESTWSGQEIGLGKVDTDAGDEWAKQQGYLTLDENGNWTMSRTQPAPSFEHHAGEAVDNELAGDKHTDITTIMQAAREDDNYGKDRFVESFLNQFVQRKAIPPRAYI